MDTLMVEPAVLAGWRRRVVVGWVDHSGGEQLVTDPAQVGQLDSGDARQVGIEPGAGPVAVDREGDRGGDFGVVGEHEDRFEFGDDLLDLAGVIARAAAMRARSPRRYSARSRSWAATWMRMARRCCSASILPACAPTRAESTTGSARSGTSQLPAHTFDKLSSMEVGDLVRIGARGVCQFRVLEVRGPDWQGLVINCREFVVSSRTVSWPGGWRRSGSSR